MRQTVYIDILVLLNTIVNFYILIITGLISHSRIIKRRIVMGGLAGGLLSCTVLLPEMNEVLSLILKALTCAGIVFISFEASGRAKFFKRYICFLSVNFIFAGAVLFFCMAFETPLVYYNNSNFYFDLSAPFLVVIATLTYFLLSFTLRTSSKATNEREFYELSISKGGESAKLLALSDTGNSLKDVFSDTPVIVAEATSVKKLIGEKAVDFFVGEGFEQPDFLDEFTKELEIRLIPYSDISGGGYLKAFRCDELHIKRNDAKYELKDGFIAVYDGSLSGGEYNAIINPGIFEIARKAA